MVEQPGQPSPTVTLWEATPSRWWPATPVLYGTGGTVLAVLLASVTRLNPWSLLALLVVPVGLPAVRAARARVRLTPEGVEVRGVGTTLLRYADIASVEVSPDWEGGRSVWIRLRASWPQAAPEVLTPPPGWWDAEGGSLGDVVAAVRARVDATSAGRPMRPWAR